jgi:hypothetical protein
MTYKFHKTITIIAIAAVATLATLSFNTQPTNAAVKATDFNAGNIIDDAVFYNKDAMTLAQIEAFIQSKTVTCDTWGTKAVGSGRTVNGVAVNPNTTRAKYAEMMRNAGNTRYHAPPYVCFSNYFENPTTKQTSFDTGATRGAGMLSAAEIIYQAAQDYNINPQVLLVTLKKEYSYIYTDDWPLRDQYNTVMGYACPDSGPNNSANCSSKYFGFYNQVRNAAWQFNQYRQNINSYNYRPGRTNIIQYAPTASCGSRQVFIENIATASLYIYTPYTPNAAALAAYPGTATCGAYGNRNFFMFFNEWFGSTKFTATKVSPAPGDYYIVPRSDYEKTIQLTQDTPANGTTYTLGTRTENTIDTFRLIQNSDNTYTILNISTGKVLDIPAANASEGTNIQQYDSNGTDAQKWYIYDNSNGSYSISPILNGTLALTVAPDNSIQLSAYSRSAEQSIRFIPSNQPIKNGTYNILSKLNSNFVLDVAGAETANGAVMQIYGANETPAQLLSFTYDQKTGYYTIINPVANRAIDVASSGTANGAKIHIWDQNNTCAQQWTIEARAENEFEILSACSGKALDVSGAVATNSTKIQLYSRNYTPAQRWTTREITQAIPNGTYNISSSLKTHYLLDVKSGGTANGTNIWMYEQNGTGAQTFMLTYNPKTNYYTIVNPQSSKVIDVAAAGKTNGTKIQIYANNSTCAQQWRIVSSSDGTYEILSACSGLVLDVQAAGTANSTNVQIYEKNSTPAQKWKFVPVN